MTVTPSVSSMLKMQLFLQQSERKPRSFVRVADKKSTTSFSSSSYGHSFYHFEERSCMCATTSTAELYISKRSNAQSRLLSMNFSIFSWKTRQPICQGPRTLEGAPQYHERLSIRCKLQEAEVGEELRGRPPRCKQ